ncbi:MAG TPA: condensation domain-containing protein, partial [Methanocorpusculum sp.]|nr:condensation domain-containing protein [Methanocorpusculum sp.]
GKTLVHTGDIGFIDDNGDVNYVTRKDWMVKINGQRVEALEVERVLQSVEYIREAAVKAFTDAESRNYLVGYYVSDVEKSSDDIRISLAEKLPSYMIPRYLVRLDAIPKNQNGKTDRTVLVPPKFTEEFTEGGKEIPSSLNELQKGISDIVAKLVGHRGIGITTKFYDAGIDSLGMIKLIAELERNYHITLQMDTVNQYNTAEKLSEYIASAKQEETFPIQEDYPLSKLQKIIYSWCKYYPRYYPSLIVVQLKLWDTVDRDRFVKAVETVINAHPYLKTTFRINDEGEVRAVRNDSLKPSVLRIKCESLPKREDLLRPHELVNSPLYRAEIYETPSGTYFYLDMHHTITDGVSLFYIFKDICSAYLGKELEKESCTGFEAGLIDEIKMKSESLQPAKKYYANLLRDCIPTIIPCSTDAFNPKMIRRELPSTLSLSEINAYCAEHRCSANALYHAAFAYLLNTYVGTNDVLFHTIHSGRTDSRYANSLSLYAAPAPVRCSFTGDKKIENVISDMEYHLHESISHCVNSHADIEANEGSTTKIWFINESNNMEVVNKLTNSQMILPDIMQVFDVRDMVMDVLIPPKYEQAGSDYNGCVQIHWYIVTSLSGDLAFSVMGDGGRYSESFLDEMLSRYDKIIREFTTKEYLSEMVI